jgi:hypothetical protein
VAPRLAQALRMIDKLRRRRLRALSARELVAVPKLAYVSKNGGCPEYCPNYCSTTATGMSTVDLYSLSA